MILSLMCSSLLALPFQTPREYVVREVRAPEYLDSEHKYQWVATWFSGDHDANGDADFMLWGFWLNLGPTGPSLSYRFGYHSSLEWEEDRVFEDLDSRYSFSLGEWALLRTPTGFQAIIDKPGFTSNDGLVSIDWDTGVENGVIPFATGFPPPIPDAGKFESLFPAGDQDGDGFEDFFWTNRNSSGTGYAYCGLYSGATLQSIWQWAEGKSGPPVFPYHVGPGNLPDFNGDGKADFLVGISHFNPFTGAETQSYIAFSGPDGAILWRVEETNGVGGIQYGLGPDLSGDGIPDPVFLELNPRQFRAIDATDGSELWVTTLAGLLALFPGQTADGFSGWRGFMSNLDNPSLKEYVNYHYVIQAQQVGTVNFAHYDAYDGTLIGSYPIPLSLMPWSPDDSGLEDMDGNPFRLGDIDRDGLDEIAVPVKDWQRSPLWSITGPYPNPGNQLAVIGLRTLFVAETHQLGAGPLNFNIAVPAGVNSDFAILVSTEFDPNGGLELGPWRTFLAPSAALDHTFSNRTITGTLDGNGKGFVSVGVPSHPSLLGETLYSKALILNPTGSAEVIKTMSSLGITELH